MRLARTGLPVGHNSPVKSIKDIIEHRLSHLLKNLFLRGAEIEYVVVEKYCLALCVLDC
jgi:hypothetical protein